MAEKGVFQGISDAIADIREKVVEEGWFGRSLSDNSAPPSPEVEPQPGFGSSITHVEKFAEWPEAKEAQPDLQQGREIDRGIDR